MRLNKKLKYLWLPIRKKVHQQIEHKKMEKLGLTEKFLAISAVVQFLTTELDQIELRESEYKKLFFHGCRYILRNSDINIPKVPKFLRGFVINRIINAVYDFTKKNQ